MLAGSAADSSVDRSFSVSGRFGGCARMSSVTIKASVRKTVLTRGRKTYASSLAHIGGLLVTHTLDGHTPTPGRGPHSAGR